MCVCITHLELGQIVSLKKRNHCYCQVLLKYIQPTNSNYNPELMLAIDGIELVNTVD